MILKQFRYNRIEIIYENSDFDDYSNVSENVRDIIAVWRETQKITNDSSVGYQKTFEKVLKIARTDKKGAE